MKDMDLVGLGAVVLLAVAQVACGGEADPTGSTDQSLEEKTSPSPDENLKPAPNPNPNDGPGPIPGPTCHALAGPSSGTGVGLANPASVYCSELGYKFEGERCVFLDNTSCEQWAFYRGECGASHSFCARQGGTVTSKTEDMGGWTAKYALCTLPTGQSCKEQDFASTCRCE